jgi:hypothetical protein
MGSDAERCGTKTTYETQAPMAGMLKLIYEKISIKERNALYMQLHGPVAGSGQDGNEPSFSTKGDST